jgi:hypothetical protein
MEKRKFLPPQGLELRHLGRPTCSQWQYRLRYPGGTEVNYENPESWQPVFGAMVRVTVEVSAGTYEYKSAT